MIGCPTFHGGAVRWHRGRVAVWRVCGKKNFAHLAVTAGHTRSKSRKEPGRASAACRISEAYRGAGRKRIGRRSSDCGQRRCAHLQSPEAGDNAGWQHRPNCAIRNDSDHSREHGYSERFVSPVEFHAERLRGTVRKNRNSVYAATCSREMNSSLPYKVFSTSVYSGVTEVRFYDETVQHIIEEHPEVPLLLPSITAAVERCIISPD
jgi:hypothetical protein